MVRLLVDRGHRVSCVVPESYPGIVEAVRAAGASVVLYPSSFPAVVPAIRTADELAEMYGAYARENVAALPSAWPRFADDPVDLVVDDVLSTYASRLVAQRAGCPVVCMFAGPAGNEEVPLNGSRPQPGDPVLQPDHPIFAQLQEELPKVVADQGLDPIEAEKAIAGVVPAANLVFVPRSFQPHADRFDPSYVFVGPGQPEPAPDKWRPPAGRRVALISLGTCARSNPRFFRDCAEAFADTDWHLVMTSGGHLDPEHAGELPGSVELHTFLDHAMVLPHADVLVCQAGSGTVMGAFSRGVPVVGVPQQPDHYPLAVHLEALGLGRALLSADVTGAEVRAAVEAVTSSGDTIARVKAMAVDIREAGGAPCAVEVLEELACASGAS